MTLTNLELKHSNGKHYETKVKGELPATLADTPTDTPLSIEITEGAIEVGEPVNGDLYRHMLPIRITGDTFRLVIAVSLTIGLGGGGMDIKVFRDGIYYGYIWMLRGTVKPGEITAVLVYEHPDKDLFTGMTADQAIDLIVALGTTDQNQF